MSDLIAIFERELLMIEQERARLDFEQAEIETALRVARRLCEPQATPPAQTVAALPSQSAAVTPAAVESVAAEEVVAPREDASSAPIVADVHSSSLESGAENEQAPEKADAPPPAGEVPPASPAPSLRARIEALHTEHPEFTFEEAREALQCKRSSLSSYSSTLKIKWQAAETPASARSPAPAPTPTPTAERPSAIAAEPALSHSSAVITKPMHRPKGARFYLRNDIGEFLHFSCGGMTKDRSHAWIGDERRLAGCRRAFTIAAGLREEVVGKQMVAA